jgi:hypothetical protein
MLEVRDVEREGGARMNSKNLGLAEGLVSSKYIRQVAVAPRLTEHHRACLPRCLRAALVVFGHCVYAHCAVSHRMTPWSVGVRVSERVLLLTGR